MNQREVYRSAQPYSAEQPEALAIVCSDGRFLAPTLEFVQEHLGLRRYHLLVFPGAIHPLTLANLLPKEFKTARRKLTFLVEKHPIRRIVCVAHEDCGWYKDFKIGPWRLDLKERQLKDLEHAARVLHEWFPHVATELYYARLDGETVVFDRVG